MAIRSMTGFARADGVTGSVAWAWEVRSVNGRGLDMRLRLPPGYEQLEPRIRETVGKRIARGNLSINLNVKRSDGETSIRLNEAALAQVLAALERLKTRMEVAPPRPEALLGIKGVLEVVEPEESEAETQARTKAMLAGLAEALDGMVRAREAEGRHLEAAILATRADVEEELKRLGAHIAATRELLASGEPAGRRLDFLAQEFNREANTVCSKSNDAETTRAGLELKAVIDQMREQVQNIE